MKISKKDAYTWFKFFATLPEEEQLTAHQSEIVYAAFAQIEEVVDKRNRELMASIGGLKTLQNRTYYVGNDDKFPNGCKSCLLGTGLSAVRKTNKCNLECKFCYNYGELDDIPPVGEGMWEIGETKYYEKDIDLLLSVHKKPTGISYVYLEPFMEIEKYYPVIKKFHDANIHQHMYTNGTLVTGQSVKILAGCGLDELRFNLGATNCSDKVIDNMRLAAEHIRSVGIETPMTPEFIKGFFEKKNMILNTGIKFINCAELHLNPNNIANYYGENMYISRHGYISPVWSRELSLKLMKTSDDEKWDIVVHDCSNYTKFVRGLNLSAKEGKWFGANDYACEFPVIPYEYFLPILQDESFQFSDDQPLLAEYADRV